jgi:hypothetical protein
VTARRLAAIALFCGGACGTGNPAATDGGAGGDGGSDGIAAVAPPIIDWLDPASEDAASPAMPPVLTPCPEGWREVAGACDPWPETGPADCTGATAHFVGEPGCVEIGAGCPAGAWPDDALDDGSFVYVAEGASGGDGSRGAPFGTIGEAMAGAATGQTVLVGAGSYRERVGLAAGVTLRGVCAALTRLASLVGEAAVVAIGRDGAVRDLTVSGGQTPGIVAAGGSRLVVEGVVVDGAFGVGVVAAETRTAMELRGVAIRDTRALPDGTFGWGLSVQDGARVDADRVSIVGCRERGANVVEGGDLTLRRASIRATQQSPADIGYGLVAYMGGTAALDRVAFHGNQHTHAQAEGADSRIVGIDAVFEEGRLDATGQRGRGLAALDGGEASVARARFARQHTSHTFVRDGTLELADVVLEDGLQDGSGRFGRAIEVVGDGTLTGSRVAIRDTMEKGVVVVGGQATLSDLVVANNRLETAEDAASVAVGATASIRLERAAVIDNRQSGIALVGGDATLLDVLVARTRNTSPGVVVDGVGVRVESAGTLVGERLVVERSEMVAVAVTGEGTTTSFVDMVLRNTGPQPTTGLYGRGIDVSAGASVELTRVRVANNVEHGIATSSGSLSLTDVEISDTAPSLATASLGRGLSLQRGSSLTATRLRVSRSYEIGVLLLSDVDTTLQDLVIETVRANDCEACAGGGIGLGAWDGSLARVERFVVADAELCGVLVGTGGGVDLAHGEVRGCAIGACVPSSGFEVSRLQAAVRYRDNGVNLQATELPVPNEATSIGE